MAFHGPLERFLLANDIAPPSLGTTAINEADDEPMPNELRRIREDFGDGQVPPHASLALYAGAAAAASARAHTHARAWTHTDTRTHTQPHAHNTQPAPPHSTPPGCPPHPAPSHPIPPQSHAAPCNPRPKQPTDAARKSPWLVALFTKSSDMAEGAFNEAVQSHIKYRQQAAGCAERGNTLGQVVASIASVAGPALFIWACLQFLLVARSMASDLASLAQTGAGQAAAAWSAAATNGTAPGAGNPEWEQRARLCVLNHGGSDGMVWGELENSAFTRCFLDHFKE